MNVDPRHNMKQVLYVSKSLSKFIRGVNLYVTNAEADNALTNY